MEPIPTGLAKLLEYGHLPTVALTAAVDQIALREPVSRRRKLPGRVVERCFAAGAPPPGPVAEGLVGRRLPARTVRWLLGGSGERRPEVLAALLKHNVPGARERRRLLAHPDERIPGAVLGNPDWPVDEQLAIAGRAHGATVMRWLTQLDPDVPVTPADLLGAVSPGRRLGGMLRESPLAAMLRRPWLAELPGSLLTEDVRCAAATIASEECTLYALLGHAQRLATGGRLLDAAGVIEAVACNPAASLAVPRRCRRLTRWIPCHYLEGWRPARAGDGPLWEADATAQRRVMSRLEELSAVRHRTVWSAALLATNPDLADDVRDRLVAYLDEHIGAAVDDGSVDLLADRLRVSETTRKRWREACRYIEFYCGTAAMRPYWDEGLHGGPAPAWEELELAGCAEAPSRRLAVRRLRDAFGTDDEEVWSLAWLLLREGWDLPLAVLPSVVASLRPEEGVNAA
jgi:hypothetical protein